jgi:hypothetical protein
MKIFNAAALAACMALTACAAEVVRHPSAIVSHAASAQRSHVLTQATALRLDSGYERSISAGTEFVEVGTLREGRVLKPVNATLTVEGKHMHEAYAVVQGDRLVGFYLPVEQSFVPLSQTVTLTLQERKPQ